MRRGHTNADEGLRGRTVCLQTRLCSAQQARCASVCILSAERSCLEVPPSPWPPGPGCPAQGDPCQVFTQPWPWGTITTPLHRGPCSSHTTDQGAGRADSTQKNRLPEREPLLPLCLLGAYYERALGTAHPVGLADGCPHRAAASSLLCRAQPGRAACLALRHSSVMEHSLEALNICPDF